jgi:hypothetical protein
MTGTTGPDPITVDCRPDGGGWMCTVTVGADGGATTHQVAVGAEDQARLAGPGVSVEQLVRESFGFLLAREPRESILRDFDLPVIGHYFPEYEAEIRRRLEG